jgi:superfamily II DNA or RNA helicase
MSVKIIKMNPVWSRVTEGRNLVAPCLLYKKEYWRQGPFAMERSEDTKTMMWGVKILTGHVPRILDYCEFKKIPVSFLPNGSGREGESTTPVAPPLVSGVTFRPDQLKLIESAVTHRRGILKAPTGTGKTILAMGIMSCFPQAKILILCHNVSLVTQMADELGKFGFNDVAMLHGKSKSGTDSRILVSTMQSYVKVASKGDFPNRWDMLLIDEAHHVSSLTGTYAKILSQTLSPIRLGFTATLPDHDETKLAMEGLLGPVIDEVTLEDAAELGLLARPNIRILRVPFSERIRSLSAYKNIYSEGIVHNRARNRLIAKTAVEYALEGMTSLIIVTHIDHGNNIQEMARNIYQMEIPFVRGSTEAEVRDDIKKGLKEKDVKSVICVAGGIGVWREGINIPSLNVIINASGGKSELALLQVLGRGLRLDEGKTEMDFVDFFDKSHPKLIEHFGERICVYSDNGWL